MHAFRTLDRERSWHQSLMEGATQYDPVTNEAVVNEAWSALVTAQEAYDATPGGMCDLREEITDLQEDLGDDALADPAYQALVNRLISGKARRAEQMSLYRATRNPSASEGACGYTTAEEAAAEETSVDRQIRLCPCIAYRYKNTCEHVAANLPGDNPQAYVPGDRLAGDPLLESVPAERRNTLIAVRDRDGLRFDIQLQEAPNAPETVFLRYPGHQR
jgi:hypothetical protein